MTGKNDKNSRKSIKLKDYLELTGNLCNFGTKLYAMFVI